MGARRSGGPPPGWGPCRNKPPHPKPPGRAGLGLRAPCPWVKAVYLRLGFFVTTGAIFFTISAAPSAEGCSLSGMSFSSHLVPSAS